MAFRLQTVAVITNEFDLSKHVTHTQSAKLVYNVLSLVGGGKKCSKNYSVSF